MSKPPFRLQVPSCRADLVLEALEAHRLKCLRKLGNKTLAGSKTEEGLLKGEITFLANLIERLDQRRSEQEA